ncbi:Golgi to ER traffic protein 4 [Phlyctochytrium planicorne]|nr:Golgi to ER traffic protein 4 [Phlyctochytrium planicorne]
MSGVNKVLEKLAKSVEDGNYYEVHQMYHSVSNRYMKQKKTADAIALLHSGAKLLLTHKQVGSGSDLAIRLLDIFQTQSIPVDDANKGLILEIFDLYPLDDNNYIGDFERSVIPEKLYFDAEHHFAYGTTDSAKSAGKMAFEWSQEGYIPDGGYFIARSVLQYLALKRLNSAVQCFESFSKQVAEKMPSLVKEKIPFRSVLEGTTTDLNFLAYPLANFTQLLLYAIQRDAADQFTLLRAEYRKSLEMDYYLYQLVDRIADVWFGLGPKKEPNVIEDLMKSLFAGPAPTPRPAAIEID